MAEKHPHSSINKGNTPSAGVAPPSKGIHSSGRLLSASYQFLNIANNITDENETLTQFVDAIKKITYCAAVGIRMLNGNNCLSYDAEDGFCKEFMETEGKSQGAVLQIHDVTEIKAMKQQMDQIQHQASLGMLVSSVAHEIKNPNTFISFNLSILRDYLADMLPILDQHVKTHGDVEIGNLPYGEFREDVTKLVDTIEHGTRRIDQFLGNLREFSTSKSQIEQRTVPLSPIFENVLSLTRTKILQSVSNFHVDIPEVLPDIYTDPTVLEQILINLLVNAAQAADKSISWIRLRMLPFNNHNNHIIIQVEDNGCGMDTQTQKQLFEPLYSTKIAEGGTGLGLNVCRNLVNQLGGQLSVTSELGQGSCFTLELAVDEVLCKITDVDDEEKTSD